MRSLREPPIIIAAFTALKPVTLGLKSISEGLRSANSAVELIGKDFGSSSSLFGEVSSSIRNTREVVRETRITVEEIRQTTQKIRALVLSVNDALENLPSTIMSMIGSNYFSETISNLSNTYYTSGEVISQMEHLSATLEPMETALGSVADGVDSLSHDLFTTEEAFREANIHLERTAAAIENAAGSSFLQLALAGVGFIPLLVGLYLIIQGVAMKRIYASRRAEEE